MGEQTANARHPGHRFCQRMRWTVSAKRHLLRVVTSLTPSRFSLSVCWQRFAVLASAANDWAGQFLGYVRLASTAKTQKEQMLSAFPPKADFDRRDGHVRLVPIAPQQWQRYSITSSARTRMESGIVNPIAFAVLRLRTMSNFVACSTGRSAGFAP